MRLVIKPKSGKRRCGCGIFDTITRKLFSSGTKQAISSVAKSAIAQKVANAVVNGATSATQKAIEGAVNEVIKERVKKRSASDREEAIKSKKSKININDLIDGSGIVFD